MNNKQNPEKEVLGLGQILLTDIDGNQELFQEVGKPEYKGMQFSVLCPADIGDQKDVGLVVMQYVDNGTSLQMVEDENLCEEVFSLFVSSLGDDEK